MRKWRRACHSGPGTATSRSGRSADVTYLAMQRRSQVQRAESSSTREAETLFCRFKAARMPARGVLHRSTLRGRPQDLLEDRLTHCGHSLDAVFSLTANRSSLLVALKRTYSALSVATAGVLKTAISPLFRLPAVPCTKLRGRHEGAESGVHRFVAPFA